MTGKYDAVEQIIIDMRRKYQQIVDDTERYMKKGIVTGSYWDNTKPIEILDNLRLKIRQLKIKEKEAVLNEEE